MVPSLLPGKHIAVTYFRPQDAGAGATSIVEEPDTSLRFRRRTGRGALQTGDSSRS